MLIVVQKSLKFQLVLLLLNGSLNLTIVYYLAIKGFLVLKYKIHVSKMKEE